MKSYLVYLLFIPLVPLFLVWLLTKWAWALNIGAERCIDGIFKYGSEVILGQEADE